MGTAQSKSPFVPWESDSYRSSCSECNILFSLFNRRHHCRSCGRLVCEPCSRYTGYLWHLGLADEKVFRICTSCALKSVNVLTMESAAYASSWKVSALTGSDSDILFLSQTADLIKDARQCPTVNPYLLRHLSVSFRKSIQRMMGNDLCASSMQKLHQLLQESHSNNEESEIESDETNTPNAQLAPSPKLEAVSILNGNSSRSKQSRKHVQFSLEEKT